MRKCILLIGFIFILSGCSSHNISVNYDREFNFNSLSKFSVLYTNKDDRKDFARNIISKNITNNFKENGYTAVSKDEADFYIILHLDTKTVSEIETNYQTLMLSPINHFYKTTPYFGNYFNLNPFENSVSVTTRKYEYEEGYLIVEMLDVKSNTIIWHGEAEDELSEIISSNRIEKIVEKLFKDFPKR